MFYVFSFQSAVYIGTLNLIESIPGPSILTLQIKKNLYIKWVRLRNEDNHYSLQKKKKKKKKKNKNVLNK